MDLCKAKKIMKLKSIPSHEWRQALHPNLGTSFSTISPWNILNNGPHFAYAWAGVPSCLSGPSVPVGTVFACRYGSDGKARIKTDEWLVYHGKNNLIIQDVTRKSEIPEHYTEGTPSMFTQAPGEIKDLFEK